MNKDAPDYKIEMLKLENRRLRELIYSLINNLASTDEAKQNAVNRVNRIYRLGDPP
jgi:hypothetical protein